MTKKANPRSSNPSSFQEVLITYLEAVESGSGPSKRELGERFPDLVSGGA